MDESRTAECPSEPGTAGAAGQREAADAVVTVYENGPLIVRGRFVLAAQDGELIPAGRRTVALCRCGRARGSGQRPVVPGDGGERGSGQQRQLGGQARWLREAVIGLPDPLPGEVAEVGREPPDKNGRGSSQPRTAGPQRAHELQVLEQHIAVITAS